MENTDFSLSIKRLPYSRMLKSEMADFVEKTISIVKRHNVESESITPMFDLLRAKEPEIRLLRLSYGVDTERLRVSKLKSELMLVISAFKVQVKLLSKSEPELDIHQIQNAINKHLRYLNKCRNDKELTQKIAGFFDLVEADEELEMALSEFELSSEVNTMRAAFSRLNAASRKRVTLLSQRPVISTKTIVKGMTKALDNLFKGIEVANMISTLSDDPEEDAIDLVPLIEELNQLAEMYSLSISIRDANNKRKAEMKNETDGEEEPADEPEEPTDGDTTGDGQTTAMRNSDEGCEPFGGPIAPFSTMEASADDEGSDELLEKGDEDVYTK